MTRAALYVRVSSDRQAREGDSIPAQLDALHKYALEHNYVVYGEYIDDGISGTRSDRDELQRLLSNIDHIDIILVTKLDRLYRSIKHYLNMMDILDAHGVGWKAIWESYDTTTPQGRLIVNQMMSFAQFEAENTGQRIRQVFRYKVTQGEVLSGNPPKGYRIVDKHLVPDPDVHVREAFEIFARTGSVNAVTRACLPGIPRTHSGVKRLLKNPIAIGEYRGNPAYCEPLIDRTLWNEAQRHLQAPVRSNAKRTYIFSGLIKCGSCGCSMGGNKRVKRGRVVMQYRCPKHFNHKPALCPNTKVVTESVLDAYLISHLDGLLHDLTLTYAVQTAPIRDKTARIHALETRIRRLKDLYLDGAIDINEYKTDRADLDAQLSELEQEQLPPDPQELIDALPDNITELYATFTPEEKRRFWRGIVDHITFGADRSISVVFGQS